MVTTESGSGNVEERIARLEQQDERMARALELLAQQASAPPVKPRRNRNAYAAVIASLIGFLALGVSAYTAYVQRQQLRAQVWPYLYRWRSTVHPGWYITNVGTGAARITGARVAVDGKPVKTWEEFATKAGFTTEDVFVPSSIDGVVLPPDKDYTVLQPSENEPGRKKFDELLRSRPQRVTMAICYCSVPEELEECWFAGLAARDGNSRRDVCPIRAEERFTE